MPRRIQSTVFLVSALWQMAVAEPADPTITAAAVLPRQNKDNFIGYLERNNTWTSLDCDPGLTWYQSGEYAQCCPETLTHCYAPTACVRGSQIYTYPDLTSVRTIACTENYNNAALSICNTIFIYENSQDSKPKTNINCGDSSANWSYYRNVPATETEQVTSSPTDSLTETTTTAPAGKTGKSSTSKIWIAGAVAGPLVGLLLGGAGVWLCLRRRKKKGVQMPQHGVATFNPSQPPPGVSGYTDAKPQFQPAQQTYHNQSPQSSPYPQQAYPQQGGFSPPPMSPASPQGFQPAYNATIDAAYVHDTKGDANNGFAELGGESKGTAPAMPDAHGSPRMSPVPAAYAAELSAMEVRSDKP